jgi:hypothetical protein
MNRDMAQRQMQVAMKETEDHKGRDGHVVRWLVSNKTEDTEMESSFVMAIPEDKNKSLHGYIRTNYELSHMQSILPSFLCQVRTAGDSRANAAGHMEGEGEDTVPKLSGPVRQSLGMCKSRGLFATDGLWRKRTRACIEMTASLVSCAGVELGQFGDVLKLLEDQTIRESSLVGKDQSFVTRWTCLSLMGIRPILGSNQSLQDDASLASQRLERRDK